MTSRYTPDMPKLVWLNGEISPLETAKVSAADHAFLYGDGLFEGIRIYNRAVFKLDEHLSRLYDGIRYLGFQMPYAQATLKSHILDTCRQADIDAGYIRLNVTRGTGLGLDPAHIDRRASVMIMINELRIFPAQAYEVGLTAITSSYRVIPADSLDPRIKTIGRYAANILAKEQGNRAGVGEAIMLNHQGTVAEGTGDNLFHIKGGRIITPHPSCGILQGITRNTVMELARKAGLSVEEGFLTPYDLQAADEIFLTGTAAEVIPMVELDGQKIGDGKPGPITNQMIQLFREETKNGTRFDVPAQAVTG